jgi:hypothetical protein
MEDSFWTHDTLLFEGRFRYYHDKKQEVRGKIHLAGERYDFKSFGHGLERSYLNNPKGQRVYLLMHPYIVQPNIVMNITIQPKHYADAGTILGKSIDSRVAGLRHEDIGNAQAWYYPEDKVLVLWECFFHEYARDVPLLKDTNMASLWTGFEKWLLNRFPDAEKIVTPFADPIWEAKEYQSFLRKRGYTEGESGTFIKPLEVIASELRSHQGGK